MSPSKAIQRASPHHTSPAVERLVNPLKDDKLCRAKLAVVQTLDRMEHPRADVFLKAALHIQLEPIWGGSEDSARPLRAAALVAPAKDVRIAVAVALGAVGTEGAGLILRLKVRLGDGDPDVLSECLLGLLMVDPKENLRIVAEFLDPSQASACEAASLALGKSRLAEALGPLKGCLERCHFAELRRHILLAIAILRRPAAVDFLLDYVATESESDALGALSALRIYKDDPRLRERIVGIVHERGSGGLRAALDRDFR